jgi:hypothetical protein
MQRLRRHARLHTIGSAVVGNTRAAVRGRFWAATDASTLRSARSKQPRGGRGDGGWRPIDIARSAGRWPSYRGAAAAGLQPGLAWMQHNLPPVSRVTGHVLFLCHAPDCSTQGTVV